MIKDKKRRTTVERNMRKAGGNGRFGPKENICSYIIIIY
jgi:hypothetical protein